MLGTPSPAVTPTNLLYNVVATPGALDRFWRQGQTGGRLTTVLLAGTIPGVIAVRDTSGATPAELRGRRGQAIAARKKAVREWEETNPGLSYDPGLFRREVLPRLAVCKLTEIMAASGCSKGSASDIRRGIWEPHVST